MSACKSCRSAAFSKTTTKHESKRQYFTYTRGVVFSHAQKVCVLKTVIGEVHMILTFVHPKYILPFKTIITYLFGEVFYPLITVIRESKKYFTRIKRKNIETQNTIVDAVWFSSSSSRCIVWCLCVECGGNIYLTWDKNHLFISFRPLSNNDL